MRWRGLFVAPIMATVAAVSGVSTPAVASFETQPAESGTLTLASDPGEYLGQGGSYSFSTEQGDQLYTHVDQDFSYLAVTGYGSAGSVEVDFNTTFGEKMAPGTYVSQSTYIWMRVRLNGRYCDDQSSTSTFTIRDVVFGPYNYLQQFDASFEFHCGTLADPALRGDVRIVNSPPPTALELSGPSIASTGTVDPFTGAATVTVGVDCNEPAVVWIEVTLHQVTKTGFVAYGVSSINPDCVGFGGQWQVVVPAYNLIAFDKGNVQAQVTVTAYDPVYGVQVAVQAASVVKLKRA